MKLSNRDSFLNKFEKCLRGHKFLKKYEKILVCVSGGVDSCVLLSILLLFKQKYNFDIGIAHVNYNLRGQDSIMDEKLVKNYSDKFSIPFHVKNIKPGYFEVNNSESLQLTARKLRYSFFYELMKKYEYTKLAIAHNADDNAETIIFNLIRGTGIEGLKGIIPENENIIRPLLSFTRDEIMNFARKNRIKFRHDKSNFKDIYSRNFIRLRILPLLKNKINPEAVQNINRFASIFSEFSVFLEHEIDEKYKRAVFIKQPNEIYLDIKKINNYINYLKERIIGKILFSDLNLEVDYKKIVKIVDLLSKESGKHLVLGDGIEVWRDRKFIIFIKNRKEKQKKNQSINFRAGEEIKLENIEISSEILSGKQHYDNNPNIEFINADCLKGDFILRKWRNGDVFYPLGMLKRKKISDFLIDRKVPKYLKNEVFVVENDKKIVWVCGYRIDNRFRCSEKTNKIIKFVIKYRQGSGISNNKQ